jgi:putative toxin-antitoxin system antitoxin component (TIGR02293 family)
VARIARVFATAVHALGGEAKARAWLQSSNRALGGARPLDLLDTEPGAHAVETVLGRIAYGVYS